MNLTIHRGTNQTGGSCVKKVWLSEGEGGEVVEYELEEIQ